MNEGNTSVSRGMRLGELDRATVSGRSGSIVAPWTPDDTETATRWRRFACADNSTRAPSPSEITVKEAKGIFYAGDGFLWLVPSEENELALTIPRLETPRKPRVSVEAWNAACQESDL